MANGKIPRRKTAIYAGGPLRRSSRIVKPVKQYEASAEVSKFAKKRRSSDPGAEVQEIPQGVTPVPRKKTKYSKSSPERVHNLRSRVVPIPDEILLHIFKLLPIEDRMQCAHVSNQWRRVAFDRCLWTSVHLSWGLSENSLRELITQRCHENTLCLKITGFFSRRYEKEQRFTKTVTPALLAHINKTCPNLKNLELCECALDFDDIEEHHINYCFLHLTHLTLKRNSIKRYGLFKLRHGVFKVRHGLFKLLGRVVPSLHHLTFNQQELKHCGVSNWFQELSVWRVSLVNMGYMGYYDVPNRILKPLVINCKVGVLSLSNCYGRIIDSEFIDWLMKKNQVVKIIGLDKFVTKDISRRYKRYYANKRRDKTENKNAEAGPA